MGQNVAYIVRPLKSWPNGDKSLDLVTLIAK